MPELCQWVININYLAARLRQTYSKPAARFICMVKTNCRNLAVGLRQSSSKLAARSPLALPKCIKQERVLYSLVNARTPPCFHRVRKAPR